MYVCVFLAFLHNLIADSVGSAQLAMVLSLTSVVPGQKSLLILVAVEGLQWPLGSSFAAYY